MNCRHGLRGCQHVCKTHTALYLCNRTVSQFCCVTYSVGIFTAGNIGAELSYNNVGMFISSDAGNSWRQVSFTPRSSQLTDLYNCEMMTE